MMVENTAYSRIPPIWKLQLLESNSELFSLLKVPPAEVMIPPPSPVSSGSLMYAQKQKKNIVF